MLVRSSFTFRADPLNDVQKSFRARCLRNSLLSRGGDGRDRDGRSRDGRGRDGGGGNEGRMCAKRFFSVVDRDRYGRIVRSTEKSLHSLGGEIDTLEERVRRN